MDKYLDIDWDIVYRIIRKSLSVKWHLTPTYGFSILTCQSVRDCNRVQFGSFFYVLTTVTSELTLTLRPNIDAPVVKYEVRSPDG